MKNFLKRNIVVMIILMIFGGIFLYGDYLSIKSFREMEESRNYYVEQCKTKEIESEGERNFCQKILADEVVEPDFYSVLSVSLTNIQFVFYFIFFAGVIPPLILICKMFKNKYILNSNLRESYKCFIKKLLFTAYKYLWILPVLAIILMLPLLFTYSLTPEYSILYGIGWSSQLIYYPILFILLYLLNILIVSMIYVNISLVIARFKHKMIPCIILSYITFFTIEIFFEIVLRVLILQRIFHTELGMIFNIMNIFGFDDLFGIPALFIVNISLLLLSFLGVYLAYKNKEKFIMSCEANN